MDLARSNQGVAVALDHIRHPLQVIGGLSVRNCLVQVAMFLMPESRALVQIRYL